MISRPYAALGLAAATLSLALAACGGGGGHGAATPVVPAAVTPPKTTTLAGATFTWGSQAVTNATYVGPANFASLGVSVAVQMQNEAGLISYAQQVSNPKSALYRQFLTPQDIANRFGATSANYNAVAQYFVNDGLHVGGWPQRLSLFVAGTQAQMQRAFGTTFAIYRASNGKTFIAPTSTPKFTQATLPVTAVSNLVTQPLAQALNVPVRAGNGQVGGYSPGQIREVFDYAGAYAAGYTGTGVTVGVIGTGPISSADVPAYASMFHVQAAPVKEVDATDEGVAAGLALNTPAPTSTTYPTSGFPFNQGLTSPPPVTAPCQGSLPQCNPEDGEAQLDTEQIATLAPGSSVLFYLAYNPGECYESGPSEPIYANCPSPAPNGYARPELGIGLVDDEIQQAIADNSADVLSLSFGEPEISDPVLGGGAAGYYFDPNNPTNGFGPAEYAALAAEGIAVFVASGDLGAETCKQGAPDTIDDLCLSYPASDPSVVSVGGVTTPMNQFGQLTNQITAWGVQTSYGLDGSGGGVSAYFAQPAFQTGIPGAIAGKRNVPDVAMEADSSTGVALLVNASLGGPEVESIGGTSVAAPEMAAMWALVLQACHANATCASRANAQHPYRLGNPNQLLYTLYYANGAQQPTYATTFYDVLFGNNALQAGSSPSVGGALDPGYNAGVGYDQVTGLGVPFADHLINAIINEESGS
jgi:kumamolisin